MSYAFEHELLWYGIDALLHFHIGKMAGQIGTKFSLEDFTKRYQLQFDHQYWDSTRGILSERPSPNESNLLVPVREDGLYIPKCRVRGVLLLNLEYRNYDKELAERNWKPEDFENSKLLARMIEVGRKSWTYHVNMFEELKNRTMHNGLQDIVSQPENVTRLGQALIAHYSSYMGI